jgi:hypothetical protein
MAKRNLFVESTIGRKSICRKDGTGKVTDDIYRNKCSHNCVFKILYIHMKFINIYFYAIILSVTSAYGQSQIPQVLNASGGTSKSRGYTLEWSVGELALINEMDAPDSSYILTNGFIQPSDTLTSVPVQQKPAIPNDNQLSFANIRLFPNPTQDILQIQFLQSVAGKISMRLYNESGSIVYQNEITVHGSGLIEKINMKGFTNGVYILYIKKLNLISGRYDLHTGTFKIIKL